MAKNKNLLKVALYGMDDRTHKTMTLFLQGPCKDAAVVVADLNASDIAIFDGDLPASKKIMEKYFQENTTKPVLIMSLRDLNVEGVIHVKKPVNTESMLKALETARKQIEKLTKKRLNQAAYSTQSIEDKKQTNKLAVSTQTTSEQEILGSSDNALLAKHQDPNIVPPAITDGKNEYKDWFDTWFDSEQAQEEDSDL